MHSEVRLDKNYVDTLCRRKYSWERNNLLTKLLFIDRRAGRAFLPRAESYFLPASRGCSSQVPTQLSSATFFIDFSREAFTRPGEENMRGPGSGREPTGAPPSEFWRKARYWPDHLWTGEREKCYQWSSQTNGKLSWQLFINTHVIMLKVQPKHFKPFIWVAWSHDLASGDK